MNRTQILRAKTDAHLAAYAEAPIYFVQHGFIGLIKIGWSTDVARRVKALQDLSPLALTLLGWIPGGPAGELDMHRRFADSRAWGEWFAPTRDLTDFCRTDLRHDEPPVLDRRRLDANAAALLNRMHPQLAG